MRRSSNIFLFLFALLGGCDSPELDPPAAPGSGEPHLLAADGKLFLSWVEPAEADASALRFSTWQDGVWSSPQTVAAGQDWFVNWADAPSIAVAEDGTTMAAHWLEKVEGGTYAYGIRVALSTDRGVTWSTPLIPHGDDTATEHGFVSIVPTPDLDFLLIWLDGRETMAGGAMTLRTANLTRSADITPDSVLDDRVCDCCRTDAVISSEGIVLAYRDRSTDEVRDISSSVLTPAGRWEDASPVHVDGWSIAGCPVNGPSLAAHGSAVACTWFTMGADEEPQVLVALSRDGGRSFGPPVRVDDGDPIGRSDAIYFPGGSLLVSWMEKSGQEAEVRVRRFGPSGEMSPSRAVARIPDSRAVGFPQLARLGGDAFLAWTEPGEGTDSGESSRIHVARI